MATPPPPPPPSSQQQQQQQQQCATTTTTNNNEKTNERQFNGMSCSERIKYIKTLITVEPLIACYLIASVLCEPALLSLKLEKSCRKDAGFNDTVCSAILGGLHDAYEEENSVVVTHILNMQAWNSPIQNIVPLIILMTFLGSYSDKYKIRKPFMIIPIVGELFSIVGCALCAFYMYEWSVEVVGIVQSVIPSFFGGPRVLIMAVFTYIADVSSLEMRTLRIGIVQIVLQICSPLTQSFSGVLFRAIGYYGIFALAFVIELCAIFYGVFFIKDSIRHTVDETRNKKHICAEIFDPKHISDTFSVLFKRKVGNNRKHIAIVMLIVLLLAGVDGGEGSVFFYYAETMLLWTYVTFSFFSTFNTVIHLIGTTIGISLFTYFKVSDYVILIITFINKIIANIVFTCANSTLVMYIGSAVSLFYGIWSIAFRSIATKVVSADDLGKAQSLFVACEAIGPAVTSPIYNILYKQTISTLPSVFFLLSIAIILIGIVLVIWIYKSDRDEKTLEGKENPSCTGYEDVYGKDAYEITHI